MEDWNLFSNEGMEELQKATIDLLKSNIKSTKKILHIVNNFFPDMHNEILKQYDNDCIKELGISISGTERHITVKLPELSKRSPEVKCRLFYEDTLVRMLNNYKVANNIETLKEVLVVYEHITSGAKIRDNDNYSVMEQKNILDCIVSSGLIDTDRGDCCSICHITTIKETAPHTVIHIIKASSNAILRIVTNGVT